MIFAGSLTLFLLVTIFSYVFVYHLRRQRLYKLSDNLPGQEISIFKAFRLFLLSSPKNIIQNIRKVLQNGSTLTKTWFFGYFVILTKDADFINKILNSPQTYNKVEVLNKNAFLRNGLISLNGHDHKRHRKIFNKAFTTKMLQQLPKIFDIKSRTILTKIRKNLNCGEFDVIDYVGAYALDSFSRNNLNYDFSHLDSEIFGVFKRSLVVYSAVFPYLLFGISRKLISITKIGQEIETGFKTLQKFKNQVVKANIENPNIEPNLVMSLLLNPQNEFSEEEIFDEMFLISLAAYDTSSKVVSTVLMMLGIHKDIQQKLFEEINEIYSNESKSALTIDFLNKFSYLEAVIKETMRIFTVVPFIVRQASEDVEINGHLIPKDTVLIMSLDAMHRDEKYWGSDALEFKPKRYLEELKSPHAFAPFADGRRICIGYRYAMISMKVFLINFLRNFKVDCSAKIDQIETEMAFTLNIVNGYRISIQNR